MNTVVKKMPKRDLGDFWEIVVLAGSEGYYPQRKEGRVKWFTEISKECPGLDYYGAYRDDVLLGGMVIGDYTMNLRGAVIPLSGVGMVHTDMLHKKEKICKEMMAFFLQHNREKDVHLLYLSPFRPDFYKQMGFGYGSTAYDYRIPPASFPNTGAKEKLSYLPDKERTGFLDCYGRVMRKTHGMISRNVFFTEEQLGGGKRAVVYKEEGVITGVLVFSFGDEKEMVIHEWFCEDARAFRAFCSFLHTQSDQFHRILFTSADEYLYYALRDPTDGLRDLETCRCRVDNMFRVVDAAGLFRDLRDVNFGGANLILNLRVRDDFFAPNNGVTCIRFENGYPRVMEQQARADLEITLDVADFSSLMVGAVNPSALFRLGLLELSDTGKLKLLDTMFHAPKPLGNTHI